MTKELDPNDRSIEQFLALGSEIAGGVSGASIGMLLGGGGGAMAGAIVGPFAGRATRVVGDYINRQLSGREQVRAASVILFATDQLQQKIRIGYELRTDQFFAGPAGKRVAGDEVIEGVLVAAQREYEELKLPLLGTLLANLAIRTDIDSAHANRLIAVVNGLTYRQLCFLALCGTREHFEIPWQPTYDPDTPVDLLAVWDDIEDLLQKRLAHRRGGRLAEAAWTTSMTNFTLRGLGVVLYDALDLWQIYSGRLSDLDSFLQRPAEAK